MNESDFSILLVDDDELVLLSLELILSDKGYRVFNTSHSENILEIIEREKIDLIVLDYYLYGVNGVEILSKIRSVELFAHIPILMLTSEESPDIIENCLDSGATDFIIKPVIPKVLLARIRSALSNREYILQIESQKKEISDSKEKLSEALASLEKDLRKARNIQETLIPKNFISSRSCKMFNYYKPMNEVGGDFFSFLEKEDTIDLLFGDVSGHGISSAMVSCMAVLCFQTMDRNNQIEEEFKYLHQTLFSYVKGHYITGIYLRLDTKNKILQYAYAGHHPAILIRNNQLIELEGKGTPLILMREFITTSNSIQLEKGDKIFLFSDGLYEIYNLNNEFYGSEQFLEKVKDMCHLQGNDFLKSIFNFSINYSGNVVKDDMTLLLIEI